MDCKPESQRQNHHLGHNAHIEYSDYGGTPSMGGYLKRYFAPQVVNFGFVFDQGSFRASDSQTHHVATFTLNASPKGTWESALAATGIPLFALNLRLAVFAPETLEWMQEPHPTHSLGAVYDQSEQGNYWYPAELQKEFDAVFFVENTTASHGLPE
ncbi:MAG TPA: erythromycin esterase family protein [Silvibacterium sp.]|nr:erythromycin esterase family protein [Silvibacterium sp.]